MIPPYQQILDHMNESGIYNESDLAPFHRRIAELRCVSYFTFSSLCSVGVVSQGKFRWKVKEDCEWVKQRFVWRFQVIGVMGIRCQNKVLI